MLQRIPFRRNYFTTATCFDRHIKTSKERRAYFEEVRSWNATGQTDHVSIVEPRLKKSKVALMLGFNGSNYQGMQTNIGAKTIEQVVFDALCEVGAVSKSNATDPKKVQLMRAARTDKGVHASCNLISLKMICQDPALVEKLNQVLPNDIRIWGYVETQRGFHAKNKCDSRIYEYFLPSYTLQRQQDTRKWTDQPTTSRDVKILTEDGTLVKYMTPTDPKKLASFRVNPEKLNKFKEAMGMFQGTHNFHNYTIARSFQDRAAQRFMIDINVEEPKLIGGMEWISVKLHGQSFMLHQIRKMISMAMLCVRTDTPLSLIPKTFESTKINIPKAPSLGLLLDRPVFDSYNRKIESIDNRQKIGFDLFKGPIEKFKQDCIYSYIFKQELEHNVFESYLLTIDSHLKVDYTYFNKDGVIPDDCMITTKYSS